MDKTGLGLPGVLGQHIPLCQQAEASYPQAASQRDKPRRGMWCVGGEVQGFHCQQVGFGVGLQVPESVLVIGVRL